MHGVRARVWFFTVGAVALAVLVGRGQSPASTGITIVEGLGLPAVDTGAFLGEHKVWTESARGALSAAVRSESSVGLSGSAYVPGKVIVKFRGESSAASHVVSLRTVSPTALMSTRPDYADFDVV